MKKYLKVIITSLILVLAVAANWIYSPHVEHESVHYHAGFRVYIDDQLQDYSGYEYMNFVPCSEHDQTKTAEEEQMEKAHLHDGVGDVVHVHRSGAVWGDLFANIGVQLPSDKELKGYVDGVEHEDIMEAPITAYTTAIFAVGDTSASRSAEVVSKDHIVEVEAKSELCGS